MSKYPLKDKKLLEIRDIINNAEKPLTYQDIADRACIHVGHVDKILIQRIFGIENYPTDKLSSRPEGRQLKKPVFGVNSTILITKDHLQGLDIPLGTRFNVERIKDNEGNILIALTNDCVDQDYLKKNRR